MLKNSRTKTGGFMTWIKVVAWILVIVFAPEQIAWAIDYDWRSIWRTSTAQASNSATIPYAALKSAGFEKQIAFNIKESLGSLQRTQTQSLQFSNDVIIERA